VCALLLLLLLATASCRVEPARVGFHTSSHIFPFGYTASAKFLSSVQPPPISILLMRNPNCDMCMLLATASCRVEPTRAGFHTSSHIFPLGYTASAKFPSSVQPGVEVAYTCMVADGGPAGRRCADARSISFLIRPTHTPVECEHTTRSSLVNSFLQGRCLWWWCLTRRGSSGWGPHLMQCGSKCSSG
jgi:hypothetical protein